MAISTPASGDLRLALDQILVRDNVRDLDEAHVDSLAQSIALRGLLVPLIVRPTEAGYELVAGHHRLAACRKLDLPDAPVVVRDTEGSSADAAAENVTSCRRRHDATYADSVVMPDVRVESPLLGCEPRDEVGIRTRTDPGGRRTTWLKVGCRSTSKRARQRTASGTLRASSAVGISSASSAGDCICLQATARNDLTSKACALR